MKVKIKDYQAIKEADLEFLPGVTVIIGSSNNGKSSIIRAIEAAINNKGGSDFINYDSDVCEVTIEDCGHKVIWSKNRNSNKSYYDLDGKVLNKIGQKQLDEVGQLLNMSEVLVNNEKFRLNFWKQLDFPFLVGKSHYQLFDFISKSKDQEIIASLEDKTGNDIKNAKELTSLLNAQINLKTKDITKKVEEIKLLEKFDQFDVALFQKIVSIHDTLSYDISEFYASVAEYDTTSQLYYDADTRLDALTEVHSAFESTLSELKLIENYLELANAEVLLKQKLEKANDDIKTAHDKQEKVQIKLDEIKKISDSIKDLQDALRNESRLVDELNDETNIVIKIENKIKEQSEELEQFDACPFCGSSLESHEVHND